MSDEDQQEQFQQFLEFQKFKKKQFSKSSPIKKPPPPPPPPPHEEEDIFSPPPSPPSSRPSSSGSKKQFGKTVNSMSLSGQHKYEELFQSCDDLEKFAYDPKEFLRRLGQLNKLLITKYRVGKCKCFLESENKRTKNNYFLTVKIHEFTDSD
jgi:hypothetical protein